jgi:O-acetyl-ADP-ribose deacetylase (regulator of RNase III)
MRELLVGQALVVPTRDHRVPWLISAPTMRVPMRLRQSVNTYLAMKALLLAAGQHREVPPIDTVAIPALGTGCGGMDPETAAGQMWQAYREVVLGEAPYPSDFGDAQRAHIDLYKREIVIWG